MKTAKINNDDGVGRVLLTNEENNIIPQNILIYGGVGSGKTLASAEILDYYHRNGYTIISLSDVKDEIEQGFSMFEPESPYHLRKIRRYGSPQYKIQTKIYHPFTFNIPTYPLPNINFFTINIKSINRIDLNFLSESIENKKSIQILLDEINRLKRNEGLHHLIFYAENQTESIANMSRKGMRFRSDDADSFYTKGKSGTEKTGMDITGTFKPFLQDYCITPENCDLNLDIKELMNDQKHYHIFTYKWINDRRLKSFFVLYLINKIISNADIMKHPIILYIEEIRFLVPHGTGGYIDFLAEELKNTLTRMRNMGKGFGTIMTTQVYGDTNEKVIATANETIIGKLTAYKEYESIGRALKLKSTDINLLMSIRIGEFVIKTVDDFSQDPTFQKVKLFMPPHAHKDEGYNFFEMYKKHYPHEMRQYGETIKYVEELKTRIEEEVKILKDKENEIKKSQAKKEREEKQYKDKLRLKIEQMKSQKKTAKKDEIDDKMRQIIYEEWERATGKDKSTRAIARKLKLFLSDGITENHTAVRRAIAFMKEKNDTTNIDEKTINDESDSNDTDEENELYDDKE